jgi:hypothetical protein
MSDFDFGEAIEALAGKDGEVGAEAGLIGSMEAAASQADADSAFKNFKESTGGKNFNSLDEGGDFWGKFTEISPNSEGGWDIKDPESGKTFNTRELQKDLLGTIEDEVKPPDLAKAFSDIGVPDSAMDTQDFKNMDANAKSSFEETKTAKEAESVNESTSTGENMGENVGEPEGATDEEATEDMKEKLDKAGKTEKMNETIEKVKSGAKNLGRWILYTGLAGVAGFGALEFYKSVKQHQNAMNGCWLIKMSTGEKCKIRALSCGEGEMDQNNGQDFQECQMCPDVTTCKDLQVFNPCLTGIKATNSKQPFPGTYTEGADPSKACSNCSSCVSSKSCNNEVCSKMCNTSSFVLPTGYSLKCVSVNFWGAFDDIVDGGLGSIDNLFKQIIKVMIWIVVAIVAIIIVYYIIKFILGRIGSGGSHSGGQQVDINVHNVPTSAFRMCGKKHV